MGNFTGKPEGKRVSSISKNSVKNKSSMKNKPVLAFIKVTKLGTETKLNLIEGQVIVDSRNILETECGVQTIERDDTRKIIKIDGGKGGTRVSLITETTETTAGLNIGDESHSTVGSSTRDHLIYKQEKHCAIGFTDQDQADEIIKSELRKLDQPSTKNKPLGFSSLDTSDGLSDQEELDEITELEPGKPSRFAKEPQSFMTRGQIGFSSSDISESLSEEYQLDTISTDDVKKPIRLSEDQPPMRKSQIGFSSLDTSDETALPTLYTSFSTMRSRKSEHQGNLRLCSKCSASITESSELEIRNPVGLTDSDSISSHIYPMSSAGLNEDDVLSNHIDPLSSDGLNDKHRAHDLNIQVDGIITSEFRKPSHVTEEDQPSVMGKPPGFSSIDVSDGFDLLRNNAWLASADGVTDNGLKINQVHRMRSVGLSDDDPTSSPVDPLHSHGLKNHDRPSVGLTNRDPASSHVDPSENPSLDCEFSMAEEESEINRTDAPRPNVPLHEEDNDATTVDLKPDTRLQVIFRLGENDD